MLLETPALASSEQAQSLREEQNAIEREPRGTLPVLRRRRLLVGRLLSGFNIAHGWLYCDRYLSHLLYPEKLTIATSLMDMSRFCGVGGVEGFAAGFPVVCTVPLAPLHWPLGKGQVIQVMVSHLSHLVL